MKELLNEILDSIETRRKAVKTSYYDQKEGGYVERIGSAERGKGTNARRQIKRFEKRFEGR